MFPITTLGNTGVKVLLLRRTGENTVKTAIGYRDARGVLQGWYAARPPTHWDEVPSYPSQREANG